MATQTPPSDVDVTRDIPDSTEAIAAQKAVEKAQAEPTGPSYYHVLLENHDRTFAIHVKNMEADSPEDARRKAIKEDPQLQEKMEGPDGVTLVAINARFWKPKTARVKVSHDIEFS